MTKGLDFYSQVPYIPRNSINKTTTIMNANRVFPRPKTREEAVRNLKQVLQLGHQPSSSATSIASLDLIRFKGGAPLVKHIIGNHKEKLTK